jgi:hypothetical protein
MELHRGIQELDKNISSDKTSPPARREANGLSNKSHYLDERAMIVAPAPVTTQAGEKISNSRMGMQGNMERKGGGRRLDFGGNSAVLNLRLGMK